MTKPSAPTKAELHEMLAEAVRNTQPQPVRDAQPETKPKTQLRNTPPAPKRTVKIKRVVARTETLHR
jgi:hypothetical protein